MSLGAILGQINGPPTPTQAFNFLLANCTRKVDIHAYGGGNEGFDAELRPGSCDSLSQLLTAISRKVRISEAAADAIAVMLATAISLEVAGPFIWMHITGPSSSLKTTILELIGAASDRVFSTTEFSSFYSGSLVNGRDNSLLPKIQNKCFITKDLTPLLQGDPKAQNTIFGQMRDIYDGNGTKNFNNGVNLNYRNVRFVWLTGVTYIIYKFTRTDMGERFLICDINSSWSKNGEFVRMSTEMAAEGNAFDSIFDTIADGFSSDDAPRIDRLDEERAMCWGLFNSLLERMGDDRHGQRALAVKFREDRTLKTEIDSLAEWMEHGRCPVPSKSDFTVRSEPALPHRSVKQLSKLAICLAIVTQSDGPTTEIRRLLRKVAFDTAKSFSLEIMNLVACNPFISKDVLASRISISSTYVNTICEHLISIGVIERKFKANGGTQGRNSLCYVLTPKFRIIADSINLIPDNVHAHAQITPKDDSKQALAKIFTLRKPPFGRETKAS